MRKRNTEVKEEAPEPVKVDKKKLPAIRRPTEVSDWKAELAKYAARAQATAVGALGNWFSVRSGRLQWKGAEIQDSEVDGIILDDVLENAYYINPFDPENPGAPDCFAIGYDIDEMRPHENSSSPQNENCATCDQNKFGSDPRPGSRGKACKNIRRIGLISGSDVTADGIEDAEIGRMRVPVTSVANLNQYINTLKARGLAMQQVVTHITVEPDPKNQVKVLFGFPDPKNVRTFPDKVMPIILKRVKEAEEQLIEPYPARTEEEEAPPRRVNRASKAPVKPVKEAPGRRAKF